MAIFPQGFTQVSERCNAGERRTLHQLKRCLSDDYLVWHNIPIGPRARQPDFVVLSPRQGVLLLEVKDWKATTLTDANRDAVTLNTSRGLITEANPLRQARDYCIELVELMQQDPVLIHPAGPFAGKLVFPYGWGAVFSRIRMAEVSDTEFFDVFPRERVLMADDLDDNLPASEFATRLWGMFTVSYPHTLSAEQRDRIRWHLFPEVRITPRQLDLGWADSGADAAASTPVMSELPDLMHVMDLQQEQLARSLGEGHRVIHGAAGSGKTMILIFRAHQLAAAARPDQPVLVLCYNRQLAYYIGAQLRQRGCDERHIHVCTFHAWCIEMARQHRLPVPTLGLGSDDYPKVVDAVAEALRDGTIPAGQYTAVLLDEAHDLEDDWLRMIPPIVSPSTHSLLVLYDDTQSIYQKQRRRFNFASVGIQARGRTHTLKINYRNTAEVLALSMRCAQSLLPPPDGEARAGAYPTLEGSATVLHTAEDAPLSAWVRPTSAGRHGPRPVLIEARTKAEEAQLVAERIVAAVAQGRNWSDILVLYRAQHMVEAVERALMARQVPFQSMSGGRGVNWQHASVKIMTMHSAKGLECPMVFVVGLQGLPMTYDHVDEAMRLLYVAMTRATHELVLSACGSSAVVVQVKEALAQEAVGGTTA